jgi:hypothetical protein
LAPQQVARLDEMRGSGVSRSAFVRELFRQAGSIDEEPTYTETLILLARSARAGKVPAQVALERALRGVQTEEDPDWLARMLNGTSG